MTGEISEYAKKSWLFMEVMEVIVEKKIYRFDCPVCHSALNAEPTDLKFSGFKIGFTCPVCKKERQIFRFRAMTVTTVQHP